MFILNPRTVLRVDTNAVAQPNSSMLALDPPQLQLRKYASAVDENFDDDSGSTVKVGWMEKLVDDGADKQKMQKIQIKDAKKRLRMQKSDDPGTDEDDRRKRFRWTDKLHQYFLACIFQCGLEIAGPKNLFVKMMSNEHFARTVYKDEMTNVPRTKLFGERHIKYHLQTFRDSVVDPRKEFVKQLTELMQESRKQQSAIKSKMLNPEYHAYPFSVDRVFPRNTNPSKLGSLPRPTNDMALLENTLLFSSNSISSPSLEVEEGNHQPSTASFSSAFYQADAEVEANRPREISLLLEFDKLMEGRIQNGINRPSKASSSSLAGVGAEMSQSEALPLFPSLQPVQEPIQTITENELNQVVEELPTQLVQMQPGIMYTTQPITNYMPIIVYNPPLPPTVIGYAVL